MQRTMRLNAGVLHGGMTAIRRKQNSAGRTEKAKDLRLDRQILCPTRLILDVPWSNGWNIVKTIVFLRTEPGCLIFVWWRSSFQGTGRRQQEWPDSESWVPYIAACCKS